MVIVCLILALAHPLHTSMTALAYDPASGQATATVRAFASDIGAALAGQHHAPPLSDSAYVLSVFAMVDPTGRPMRLTWCGARRTGDVLWLCVRAPAPRGLSGLTVADRVLFDVFDDQVNIVAAEYDGRRTTLLFTKGDPPRRLP